VELAAVWRGGHERAKVRNTVENDTNGGSCQYCNMYGTTFESLGAMSCGPLSLPTSCATLVEHWPPQVRVVQCREY
jgi:hypothetical protein